MSKESEVQSMIESNIESFKGKKFNSKEVGEAIMKAADKWKEYIDSDYPTPSPRSRNDFISGAHMVAKMWQASLEKKDKGSFPFERVKKEFIVFRKSENQNSFGLFQMFVMAKDGEAYKTHVSMYNSREVGEVIFGEFMIHENGNRSNCEFTGHEMTERLSEDAPKDVIDEVWSLKKEDDGKSES